MEHNAHLYRTFIARTLRENIESYTVNQFVERFSTPHDLLDTTQEELMEIHGIGKVKASQIISAIEIVKMLNTPRQARIIIRSPKDAYGVLHNDLALKNREYFVCLFLNTKNCLIAKEIISIGSLSAAIVHPRELFRSAIKRASASVICAHNHPSGDPTPSIEDIALTKRLVEVGDLIGIPLLDHMIIGDGSYVSLKEKGYM
nr:DNA repair protein RadC [Paenibacillus xylanexedens]